MAMTFVFMASACGNSTMETESIDEVTEAKVEIGFSFDSFVLERWTKDRDIFVSTAVEQGAGVNVQNANGNLATQIEQIKYFIKKKVDVIVIVAVDSNGLSSVVNEARQNGIKVIAYDRLIHDANIDLYISFDNEKVGKLMAEALCEATGNAGKYIMLCGPTTDDNVAKVVSGFNEVTDKTGVNITASMNADNWRAEEVYEYLEQHPDVITDIDGIMCGNDNLATQAVRYLAERGLAGSIPVVGQDADLDACQRIVEGTQLMTVYKPVEQLAVTAARYAVALAEDNNYEMENITQNQENVHLGKLQYNNISQKYITVEPYSVNKENMDQIIIEGGFHLAEEVYLNVNDSIN